MRALVTGAAGFVGRHMTAALKRNGYMVRDNDLERCEGEDCLTIFRDLQVADWDLVVHCAALVEGREMIDGSPAKIAAYNLMLDAAMFDWALEAKPGRIIYFSSSAAYPVGLQRENACPLAEPDAGDEPDQTYGFVKLTGERLASEIRGAGVPVTVVRPFSGYGSDQDDCYPFPAMIGRARRRDDPFVVWGDGQQVRDFIHIDDIVDAVLTLVDRGIDGPVNLGTGRGTSMDELARLVMNEAGYQAPIEHQSDKPSGVKHRVADTTLLNEFYTPTVTLEDGIARALREAFVVG